MSVVIDGNRITSVSPTPPKGTSKGTVVNANRMYVASALRPPDGKYWSSSDIDALRAKLKTTAATR